jgi:hypothetical protein
VAATRGNSSTDSRPPAPIRAALVAELLTPSSTPIIEAAAMNGSEVARRKASTMVRPVAHEATVEECRHPPHQDFQFFAASYGTGLHSSPRGDAPALRRVCDAAMSASAVLTSLAAAAQAPAELLPARTQMGFTLGVHIILVPLGVVFPLMMLIANYRGLRRNDADCMRLAERWSKVAAVTYVDVWQVIFNDAVKTRPGGRAGCRRRSARRRRARRANRSRRRVPRARRCGSPRGRLDE